jgi:Flp pilus assembly protein TadD
MASLQDRYDDAMFAFSAGEFQAAVVILREVLAQDPAYLDARLALGMALHRLGDFAGAIAEGHAAEKLSPDEQLVHTNLSLFYLKAGDKAAAERHGLRARVASWKTPAAAQSPPAGSLEQAAPPVVKVKHLPPAPDMPWKKNKPVASSQE